MAYNILVCDDDADIVAAIEIYLSSEGYCIFKAFNGRQALDVIRGENIHLIILDVMMPEMDGIMAAVKIRETENIPIIMLSAKSEEPDRILGLNMGADDYVTKPFRPLELIARVKSQLRRYTSLGSMERQQGILVNGGIVVNDERKQVTVDGREVELTSTEYNILKLLMSSPDRVFSAGQIYETVWEEPAFHISRTVSVHIRHLREKIEIDPKNPAYIKVAYGLGYKMAKVKV